MAAKDYEDRFALSWPAEAWQDVTVVLAVSGGADSVALLRFMAACKTAGAGRLVVAHYNHRLRGEASDTDERFVLELCGRLGIECETGGAPRSGKGADDSGLLRAE